MSQAHWESPNPALEIVSISARAPKIPTPNHCSPNHKLEVPSPQLCFASQAQADALVEIGILQGSLVPLCVLMSYLMYFQISLCLLSSFCDHKMVRALLAGSSCHPHGVPASPIRCSDLWIMISSKKQSLLSQGDGGSSTPASPRTPLRRFSRQISGNDACQVEPNYAKNILSEPQLEGIFPS